jgi:hypothetical protein
MSLQVLLGLARFEVWRKPMSRNYGRWEKELRKVEFALLGHIEGEECSQESRVKESTLEGGEAEVIVLSYLIRLETRGKCPFALQLRSKLSFNISYYRNHAMVRLQRPRRATYR